MTSLLFLIVCVSIIMPSSSVTISSNFISFNSSPSCNIVYLENVGSPLNGLYLQGNTTYSPICPTTYRGFLPSGSSPILNSGFYCSPNFSQGTKLIQLNATQFTFKTENVGPRSIPNGAPFCILDTSSGLSNSVFTFQIPLPQVTGNNFYCWNSTNVNNYMNNVLMPTTATCYLVPLLSSQSTFCVYQNSVCDFTGICYMDTLLDSYNFIPVYPFVPGVWPSANITYTLTPV